MKDRVLLLKTKSSPHDGYQEVSEDSSFDPLFIPVLEHRFNEKSLDTLKDLIQHGHLDPGSSTEHSQYGAVIFTSQRAVEAFTKTVHDCRSKSLSVDALLPRELLLYVVGPATARSLQGLGLQCTVEGEESGNGDALAAFILQHYNNVHQQRQTSKPAVLFLVGEQRRETIPKKLQCDSLSEEQKIVVDEMTIYETRVMESFRTDFQRAIEPDDKLQSNQWIVVFSPTGCKVMLECLNLLDPVSGKARVIAKEQSRKTFVATIGPTTRDYLKREFGFEADACALKPSPAGVQDAIFAHARN